MSDSDTIWIEFLSSLYDDSLYKEEDNEEEVNDPEYSISEDIKQFYDEWDFRNDKAVKVSDQELDLLFDEEENDIEMETIETTILTNNETIDSNVFNKESVQILVYQMAEHIQLLTQTYLQSINTNSLQNVAQNAIQMLNEMNNYSNMKTNSIFATINLKPAIRLISDYPIEKCCKSANSLISWRSLPVTPENQKIFLSNTDIFLYYWLLPYCGYYDKTSDKNKSKTVFTLAEDHLIALGLEEFTPLFSLRKCYRYIKQLLLPIKTVDQIRTHIKNIKRRSNTKDLKDNPIMFYTLNNRAPETHSGIIDPKLDTYFYCKSGPEWYNKYIKLKLIIKRNALSCSPTKVKKIKSVSDSQNDKKKLFISQQQSPVKQTNSIVKKYRYLNRINPLKQTLAVMSNTNLRFTKNIHNSMVTSSDIQMNHLSETYSKESAIASEPFGSVVDSTDNSDHRINLNIQKELVGERVGLKTKPHVSENNNHFNPNINEDDNEKPLNENIIIEEDAEFDDESVLAALMTASSTIAAKNKIKSKSNNEMTNSSLLSLSHGKKEGRKSLAVKQRESTLQLLSLEWNESDPNSEHKEELLVHYYLEKVRKTLKHEDFVRFLTLLSEFNRKRSQESIAPGLIKEIYSQMEQFLKQLNVSKDIISEFVLFLNAEQAEECGKMFHYLYWKRFFNFVRKLEIYSSVDPQCLQRLLRSLNQLKQNEENVDKAKIRSTVSRVLNGHTYLMHEFSSLFLDEKPSQYLFEDEDFDEIVVESSDDEFKNESNEKMCFENINVPDSEDELKYGTNECPCKTCHIPNNKESFARHCTSCSIRFIGGRVYLTQNHKKLHLAEIHYEDNDHHMNKVNNDSNKHNEEDEEVNVESDNDIDNDCHQLNDKCVESDCPETKWTISQDKMLLELCRSKVIEEKRNDLSEEVFEEAAIKLSRDTSEVIARFNQLMELFTSEHECSSRETEET